MGIVGDFIFLGSKITDDSDCSHEIKRHFSSVQLLSCVLLYSPVDCSTPGFPVLQKPQTLLKLMSIESVMPCNYLALCRALLLPPSIFPSIRVFSNVSVLSKLAKVLEFQLQHHSFQRIFRTDLL